MKVVGIDLAGNPKNDTGFCVLSVEEEEKESGVEDKQVKTKLLHSDGDIIDSILDANPDIVAIDAPLTYGGENRKCDELLREYGALPVTLRGMEVLAVRGTELAKKLRDKGLCFIEVFSTASAKILGFYNPDSERDMQKRLLNAGISGDLEKKFLTKDELDAVFAGVTGYLHLKGATERVGDEQGTIVIPKV